ncbi:MAG: YibE/F family protein [Candidatus Pacebacteria bacterium]|nr:YibE/F family protein [Candidatus Paceibacterota bacterium]
MKKVSYLLLPFLTFVLFILPHTGVAQEVFSEDQGIWRGKVTEVINDAVKTIPGTDTEHLYQTIKAEVLDGPKEGEVITIENDYLELSTGDKFYFRYSVYMDGSEAYGVINIDRKGSIFVLISIFVLAVIIFGRWQGVRSLFALAGSFFAIFYILMPSILAGWNPILVSVLVASVILFAAIFFTHGFNRESAVAYGGTMIAVFLTSLFAIFSVHLTDLSGFASEASVYLNFNTNGALDFTALLLGAMIIGVLGVLDDVAVTQAAVVTELYNSNASLSRVEVYRKALRVGREHVGALVNTLVLAYVGVSLPLLLQFYTASSSLSMSINTELFATEIVRTVVGSIGLILAVPIVTLLAVFYLKDYKPKHGHSHSHGHGH